MSPTTRLFAAMVVCAGSVLAQDNYLKTREYDAGIRAVRQTLSAATGQTRSDQCYTLAKLYLAKADLYDAMHRAALVGQGTYYSLLDQKGVATPRHRYFAGLVAFEQGEYQNAVRHLEKMLKGKIPSAEDRERASVLLGASFVALGQQKRGDELWRNVPPASLMLKAEYLHAATVLGQRTAREEDLARACEGGGTPLARSAALAYAAGAGRADACERLVDRAGPGEPLIVENAGKLTEVHYQDPRSLRAVSRACLVLARHWGQVLDTLEGSKGRGGRALSVLSAAALRQGDAGRVLELTGTDAGADLLPCRIVALRKLGRGNESQPLIDILRAGGRPELLSETGYLGARMWIGGEDWTKMCKGALDQAKATSSKRRFLPQLYFRNLGAAQAMTGRLEDALGTLSEGYRIDAPDDLALNDPELILWYSIALLGHRNFRSLSDVVQMLQPLLPVYPGATQVSEAVNQIDVLTNRGIDGGVSITK